MNVLFCKIGWMKYYEGVTQRDKPKNGHENECFNFMDYNGRCYGFVSLNGNMNLESHYKEAKKQDVFLNNVLVVWVADNSRNETKIVGWYKNAVVYKKGQFVKAFTSSEFNFCYRITASAKDCYLLPEDQRNFSVQKAAQTGKGSGMGLSNIWYADSLFAKTNVIPKVVGYINDYHGKFINKVFTNEMLSQVIKHGKISNNYRKLYDKGIESLNKNDYMSALKFFNTAGSIKETPNVLFCMADSLLSLNRFDKAISVYNKVIAMEGKRLDTIKRLILCYDHIGDRKKTIEYCNSIISLLDNSENSIDNKIFYCCLLFEIYISLKDEKNAQAIINKILKYDDDDKAKKVAENMLHIIKEVS